MRDRDGDPLAVEGMRAEAGSVFFNTRYPRR